MSSARVTSIDALREFRAALVEFCETGRSALGEAVSDVQRTSWWIEHDMREHWRRELKARQNKLAEAKTDLARAQLQQKSDVIERKAVVAATRRVEEAEEKLRAIKRWVVAMEREKMLFRGQCAQMSASLDGELPKTIAWMERMIDSLQQYVALQAPHAALLAEPPPPVSEIVPSDGGHASPRAGKSGDAS
jgi:hypothetical protein